MDYVSATRFAQQLIVEYSIQTPSPRTPARLLSGGNIQKLILARELSHRPDLIIAAHPTYGLEVTPTDRIHRLLLQRRDVGAGALRGEVHHGETVRVAGKDGVPNDVVHSPRAGPRAVYAIVARSAD